MYWNLPQMAEANELIQDRSVKPTELLKLINNSSNFKRSQLFLATEMNQTFIVYKRS